MRKNTMDLY